MAETLHALIYPSAPAAIVERRMLDKAEVPPHKAPWWRPVVVVGDDSCDPMTHRKVGPVTTIEAGRVVDTYLIVPLTAQEISDAKDGRVDALSGPVLVAMLLSLHNRVRVLEGQPTHTLAQFRAAIKALL